MQVIVNKYGFKEGLTTKDGKIINWPYSEPQPSDEELNLWLAQDSKKAEIKALRNSALLEPTPKTVSFQDNLENKTFNVQSNDVNVFTNIIAYLGDRPASDTRKWTDSTGERVDLSINDFRSLRNHLIFRDEVQYDQARLRSKEVEALTSVEEVETYDINQVIISG